MTPACYRDAVRGHHGRVLSYAAWLLGDVEEARDVAQEAFLRLWSHHERVASAAARTWLLRTAHRLVVDRVRQRRPSVDLSKVLAVCGDRGPYDRVVADEQMHAVVDALGRLAHRDRALLLLREQHRLPLADIGRVLDLPPATVKTALHRARLSLTDELAEPEDVRPPQEILA
ncbi:MAG: RNA polymerase sigma factor [Planctomycetota bacterium]|jgi:RNA polymerase sigma-70 factor (ECF subfamily)